MVNYTMVTEKDFGSPKHCLRWSYGLTDHFGTCFSDFWRFWNFSDFLTPITPLRLFSASPKNAQKMVKKRGQKWVKKWPKSGYRICGPLWCPKSVVINSEGEFKWKKSKKSSKSAKKCSRYTPLTLKMEMWRYMGWTALQNHQKLPFWRVSNRMDVMGSSWGH